MYSLRQKKICDLLKGIETGDPESIKVVNEDQYIQHNPQTHEGGEGLAQLFARLSKTNPKIEVVRIFEDGDYVFGHTIYEFSSVRIGFEVFRYEGDHVVEHWDNIQPRVGTMVDGSTQVRDLELTDVNRKMVKQFVDDVFIGKHYDQLQNFIELDGFVDHSPLMEISEKIKALDYQKNHRVLAQGNFVLAVNEGYFDGAHTSFYDLFRLDGGNMVEHWDTTERVPPKSEWKNDNGKF